MACLVVGADRILSPCRASVVSVSTPPPEPQPSFPAHRANKPTAAITFWNEKLDRVPTETKSPPMLSKKKKKKNLLKVIRTEKLLWKQVRTTEPHYIYPGDKAGDAADGASDDSFTVIIPAAR